MKYIIFILSIYWILGNYAFTQNWVILDTIALSSYFESPYYIEVDKSDNSIWFGNSSEIHQLKDGTTQTNLVYDDYLSGVNDIQDFMPLNGLVYVIDEVEGLIKIDAGIPTIEISEMKVGHSLTLDSEDTLWVGCGTTYGVGYYGFQGGFYNSYTLTNTDIFSNNVYNVFEDKYNRKWITYMAFGGAGITLQEDTIWQYFNFGNSNLSTHTVRFTKQAPDGDIWIATMKGIYRYNEVLEDWEEFNKQNTNMPGEWIIDMEFDEDGRMWALFKDTALAYTYNYTDWTVFDEGNSPIKDMTFVREMALDTLGNLWLTGLFELYCLNMNGLQGWVNQSNYIEPVYMNLYPNPVQSTVFLDGNFEFEELKIFDLKGNCVYKNNKPINQIYVGDFSPGIYLVKLSTQNTEVIKRLIVNP